MACETKDMNGQVKRVWVCKECGEDEWQYDEQEPPPCKPCAKNGRWVRLTLKNGR